MRQLPYFLLSAKKFKRVFLLFFLIFATSKLRAQNYEVINHRIDSLVNLGLPKSALAEVTKLEQLARKNKNAPQQIQSVLYGMTLQSYLEENALAAIIDSLKSDINHASYPVKPVLQSLLGSMYYNYYQQNRWQFGQRSKLLKPSADYTQWDLQTLIDETSRLYLQSLKDAKLEQATSINVLDGVLQGDVSTRNLRPSLYDLLVQRALDFFLLDEPALTKPQLPFTLNDQRFFGNDEIFTGVQVKTNDTSSTYYNGIRLLQQASLFHLQKQQDEAFADLMLKRLEFMFSKSTLSNKDSLYTKALKGIAAEYATKPISADAWVDLGKYYQQKDSLVSARYYFNKAMNAYPESLGGHNASILMKQVQRRELSTVVENENMPGKPILALINYRNVKTVRYSIYHLSQQQYKNYRNSWSLLGYRYNNNFDRNKPSLEAWVKTYVRNNKPIQQQQLQLPDPHDYRAHRTEFGMDKLQPGAYLLYVEDDQSGDTVLNNYTDFQVSRLAYTARVNSDHGIEIKTVDRQTGEPLKGVAVKIRGRNYNEQNDSVDSSVTDKTGGMVSRWVRQYNTSFKLMYKGDTLTTAPTYVSGQTYDGEDEPKDKTVLFTDRQIYRPGQTIYFKGLHLLVTGQKSVIKTDYAVAVELKDQNNKTLNTLKLKSNEFGTFNCSFIIPQSILNGDVTLETEDGEMRVRVEEYKRPTFRAEFLPVTESYKLNDTVKLMGNVTAFSGYGLSRARVAYHITRSPTYNRYSHVNYSSDEVKADTIYTDEQGNFTIKYKAEADADDGDKIIYNYDITADITDGAGETHSANTYVKVGDNNINIISYLNASVFATDTSGITASINNLNGQRIKGSMQIQVYALKNPPHLFKNRVWYQKPDLFLMSSKEYKDKFPYYAFANEDDNTTWQQLAKLSDSTYTVDDKKTFKFHLNNLSKQPSGLYKVIMLARNQQGDTTSVIKYFTLVANPAKPSNMNRWITAVNNTVKPGNKAEYMVGIDEPVNVLVEKYSVQKKVSSQWVHIEKGQKRIAVPITLTDSSVNIQFMMVFQNRMYSSYQTVNIVKADKSLDIKMLTFRDKLQPGDKEQWKLQVSASGNEKQAAEMVAGMYDASLDAITNPADWRNALTSNRYYRGNYFTWNAYNFVQQTNSQPLIRRNYIYQTQSRQYETLNLFGYNYYGGYNGAYQNYLRGIQSRSAVLQRDRELQQNYERNATLVKNGVDVTGKVVDGRGVGLPGVTVNIKGVKISTSTNSNGEFKIRVLANSVLLFSSVGYNQQEIMIAKAGSLNVKLKENNASLNEVVVVGYGTQMKRSVTGAVSSVVLREDTVAYSASAYPVRLNGKAYGVSMNYDEISGGSAIRIRGASSLGFDKAPLYVVDGEVIDGPLNKILPTDIVSIDVLKDASATAIYGSRGANGVVVVTTKSGKAKLMGSQPIVIRKNFNETAFFYPQLRTDEKGEILIDFTIPEALTKWKFRAFAHTQDLKSGYIEREIVTQKQLSISVNTPRFLREGDTVTISARLANLSAEPLNGKINLQLFNGITMQPIKLLVDEAYAKQAFEIAASTNKAVSFKLAIPLGLDALTYRLTADADEFSDGEENTIPVLPNRMLVIESMPTMERAGQTKAFTLDKLINQKSTTLKNKTLTLEYTQNPAWYAVQALPYMMEFPYECSEQIFSRYYANTLGTSLINKMPVIKKVFDQWKATNSAELTSNLEKNPELKATLLEETPWLRDAVSESEQKKRIALLFDLNKMSNELQLNLDKLQKRQLSDGGFPWFGGDRSDDYITRDILAGMGQLYHLGLADLPNQNLKTIADKAIAYLDNRIITDAEIAKARKHYYHRDIQATEIHSFYVESYFTARTTGQDVKPYLANYLDMAASQWKEVSVYEQALIALTMQRNNRPEVAKAIVHSLDETAQKSNDLGMYWAKNQLGYYWYQSPIETQSLMIELFTETGGYDKEVEEMKIWLLRNKQTTNWKTTKSTAAACYALLLKGNEWLADNGTSTIKLGGKELNELKPDVKVDAGAGFIKTNWVDEAVKPALGNVNITNNGKTMSWGALHWQYLENLDKITPSNTDIHLERKYFIVKQTASGEVLTAVDAVNQPKTGDLLKVVVYLKSGREFEYVQLKDMRPAGTEPVDALSTYKYQDGLYYYQVTKDVATNFFISYLNKGSYVFEYRLRVVQPGNFSTGISTVQCMYAPEFNAHSEGSRMIIKSQDNKQK